MNQTYFLDVDHTLASFNARSGDDAVYDFLDKLRPGNRNKLVLFEKIFQAAFDYTHGKSDEYILNVIKKLKSYKVSVRSVKDIEPDVLFSRELYLKLISDELGLALSGKEIMLAIERYWDGIVRSTVVYDDSIRFLQRGFPAFIIAGGDGRLKFDDDRIVYDPLYSRRKRLQRTKNIGLSKFFSDGRIIIGDPAKKPSPDFWKVCLNASRLKDPKNAVVVDDSLKVVKDAVDFGFKGVLMDRYGIYRNKQLSIPVVSSFDDIKCCPCSVRRQ